jgi:hypothetical protein
MTQIKIIWDSIEDKETITTHRYLRSYAAEEMKDNSLHRDNALKYFAEVIGDDKAKTAPSYYYYAKTTYGQEGIKYVKKAPWYSHVYLKNKAADELVKYCKTLGAATIAARRDQKEEDTLCQFTGEPVSDHMGELLWRTDMLLVLQKDEVPPQNKDGLQLLLGGMTDQSVTNELPFVPDKLSLIDEGNYDMDGGVCENPYPRTLFGCDRSFMD